MKPIIEELKNLGCDIQGAMERFLDDEDFYCDCLDKALADPAFDHLWTALVNQQVEDAFCQAHTLKGLIANMGLTSLYNIIVEIVEPLRCGHIEHLMPIYDRLMTERQRYINLPK